MLLLSHEAIKPYAHLDIRLDRKLYLQTNYAETVKAVTAQKVQKFIADMINAGNHASIVMMPEK